MVEQKIQVDLRVRTTCTGNGGSRSFQEKQFLLVGDTNLPEIIIEE